MDNISFSYFFEQMTLHPSLAIAVILTLGVIFVNGWTDAPNAIVTCISTRCIGYKKAIIMAAVCNFLGVIIMSLVNAKVAMTIKNMVNFQGDTKSSMVALCAAMAAIVIWAIGAWYFGIPTSESHALIAGLSGAAIALQGGVDGINISEWIKVFYGMGLSVAFGFLGGYLICKFVSFVFKNINRKKTDTFFTYAQVLGGAAMAFMHGAQDGQKFLGVLLLSLYLVNGMDTTQGAYLPVWMMILCSIIMGIGTSIGGKKIIKSVGMDMVKLEKYLGFSADMAASLGILFSSLYGIPVSTTHMKTTAIIGVGMVKRKSAVNYAVVLDMLYAWLLTFPGCGLIGYLISKAFLGII